MIRSSVRKLQPPPNHAREAKVAAEARYLYCVIDTERLVRFQTPPVGDPVGPIDTLPFGGMAVVMSPCRTESCSLNRANALNHQKVMEEALGQGLTVLPIRYGTIAEQTLDVEGMVRNRLLVRRRAELRAMFERLAGKQEMSLKVVVKDLDAAIRALSGDVVGQRAGNLSYSDRIRLGIKIQEELHRRRSALALRILEPLLPFAAEQLQHPPLGDRMVLNAALLIDENRLDDWRSALEHVAADHPDLAFGAMGPMPPSSFVNLTITWED